MKINNKYLILTLLSCLLTVLNQLIYHYNPTQGDAMGYVHLAKQYASFNFFEPSQETAQESGHLMYVLFLVFVGSLINYNQYFIGVIQTLVFCLSAIFLIKKSEKFLKRDLTGLLLMLVLLPDINYFNGSISTESISCSFILLIFAVALEIYMKGDSLPKLFLLSLLLGLSILTRFESASCVFAVFFLIFPKIKDRLIPYTFIFISFPILLLFLNGIKNFETFHIFKLTAFNGGETIYGGNNQNLDGSQHVYELHEKIFIPRDKINDLDKILALPTIRYVPERDSFYHQLAWEAWKKNPVQQLGVIPEKLAKNWLLPGMFDIYTNDTTKQRGLQMGVLLSTHYYKNAWYAPYKHLFYILIHWVLLAFIIWGIWDIKKENRFQMAILVLLIFYLCYAIPFCGLPRFHVPVFPLLIIAFTPWFLVRKVNKTLNKLKFRRDIEIKS